MASLLRKFRSSRELPFIFGSPSIIWQILFFYLPISLLFISSIVTVSMDGKWTGLTLEHFASICKPAFFSIIFSSLGFAFTTAFICMIIAYPMAHFIAFKAKKYKTLCLILLVLPFWTNFLLHIYSWFFVLEKQGLLNSLLLQLGIISEAKHYLNSYFAMMIMMIYYFLPFMVLPIFSSLDKFNMRLLEASHDLGANFYQTFKRVLLPLSMPAVKAGFLLVFLPSFGEFVIPELMGGDKNYFVGNVVTQYILGETTQQLGAAFALLSCVFLFLASVVIFNLFQRIQNTLSGRLR